MTEKILKADVGDIVMVNHNSGKIYKCKILEVAYIWNKGTPMSEDYIKFEVIRSSDDLHIFFACRDKIWSVFESKNERACKNCRYYGKHLYEHPCNHCNIDIYSNWEPQEEKVDYASFYPVTTGLSSHIYDDLKRQIETRLASEQLWGIAAPNIIRCLDPTEYTPDWEAQTKVIKQLEVRANDAADPYRYISDCFKNNFGLNINTVYFDDILKEDKPMNKKMTITTVTYKREIKDIIFSGPATVIKFNNQFDKEEKTVVKCQNGDEFDKTKGFLLALVKEFVDKKSWNNILRIIDTFEEEKQDKNIAEIFDSLPEKVKNDIYVEIERASRPTRKFSGQDHVKLNKSNTGYIIERCRWNEDKKCWEYFCNNGRGYCRWYEEDRLVFA